MKNERSRNFSLITYHSEEVIKAVLQGSSQIRHYAYIFHDKDRKEDNAEELKEPHFHVLINTNHGMTESAVKKLFPESQSTLTQVVKDKQKAYEYLTHKNDPDKYQYPESDIKCDDPDFWLKFLDGGDDSEKYLNLIDDILSDVPFREMVHRYGRDFIVNADKYLKMAERIRCEERPIEPIPETFIVHDADAMTVFNAETGECVMKHRH